jgi:hypothetical protein
MRSKMTLLEHYPCPCCGYLVFKEKPGSYDVCPICYWEDDAVQLAFPMMEGGANSLSLWQAQKNFQRCGASEERFSGKVRARLASDQRDAGWRQFNPSEDPYLWSESSDDREWRKKGGDRISLYWWRSDFWLLQETPGWRFLTASPEGRGCMVDGIDVWKHKWQPIRGEKAIVKDPHYGQIFRFSIYFIDLPDRRVVFAAGEFSNSIWGFYVRDSSETY